MIEFGRESSSASQPPMEVFLRIGMLAFVAGLALATSDVPGDFDLYVFAQTWNIQQEQLSMANF